MAILLLGSGVLMVAQLHRAAASTTYADIGTDAAAVARTIEDDRPAPPTSPPKPAPVPESTNFAALPELGAQAQQQLAAAGATGAVSLIELGGSYPQSWNLNGDTSLVAASTYKQPVLMEDAQNIIVGRASPSDSLCYEDGDWEDGYFSDYTDGKCYTRSELERRVGQHSDNTAAHILVRYNGGSDALNDYARAHGAIESSFFSPNTTTSDDLARLWANEAAGQAGGAPAQQYLYPLLTHTAYEQGIPAGVPAGTTVVHKVGFIDGYLNDSALVTSGPKGPYVLAICTHGSTDGWGVLAQVSRAVWSYEASR